MSDSALNKIIDLLYDCLVSYEKNEALDQISLIDPNAKKVVGSHYSLSHYCGGLLINAWVKKDDELRGKAMKVFNYIYASHAEYAKEPDYHFDFNNFVWAMFIKLDQHYDGFLPEDMGRKCKSLLLNTGDSRHGTTNWLPMRAFNNSVRFELTEVDRYSNVRDKLLKQLYGVLAVDGMFEDNIVKGMSANPQYHLQTMVGLLIGMHFGCWEGTPEKLSKSISFFIKHIAPDGDFNFYGRGTNQIFAWGPALLVLKNTLGADALYRRCGEYVLHHLPGCLAQNGLLLECSIVHQQLQWRFYHYASVYIAHFYFWSSLAKLIELPLATSKAEGFESDNIKISEGEDAFSFVFGGMKRYLQERGPMICGVWTGRYGCLFKGPFGPFFESPLRSDDHLAHACVVGNHMGVTVEKNKVSPVRRLGRFGRRLSRRMPYYFSLIQEPVFPIYLRNEVVEDALNFSFKFRKLPEGAKFSVPVFSKQGLSEARVNEIFSVIVEGRKLHLWKCGTAIGPYHEIDLYCTETIPGATEIKLCISDKN